MPRHKFNYTLVVKFDDGTSRELVDIPETVYYYHQQKQKYWARWVENLIDKYSIKAKPISIEEVYLIEEVEPYNVVIGV